MRDIIRAIRAALRALKSWVWRVVGGVLQLVQTDPPGGAAGPDFDEVDAGPVDTDDRGAKLTRIRQLAMELACNLDVPPADLMRGIGPTTAAWLASMSDQMLLRVATSKDEALADHLAGKRSIRGVLAHDASAIDDYRHVLAQQVQSDAYELDEALLPAI